MRSFLFLKCAHITLRKSATSLTLYNIMLCRFCFNNFEVKSFRKYMKKLFYIFLPMIAASFLTGCAAFTSGEIKLDKEIASDMLSNKVQTPFAEIRVSWENFPYRTNSDRVGDGGEIDQETGDFVPHQDEPVPVDPKDSDKLQILAKDIFKKAGLYDRNKGKGSLQLSMQTINRWTYGELMHSYFVETPLLFVFPRTLPVGYSLTTEIETSTGTTKIELMGTNRTYFFLLMAPLYPIFSPSSGERKILNQIVWRMATEIYEARRTADEALKADPSLAKKKARAIKAKAEEEKAKITKKAQEFEKEKQLESETSENIDMPKDFTPTILMEEE